MKKEERDKLHQMAPVVKLSPGERFLNWYAKHTQLYIRGERGKDWATRRRLDQELWMAINPWLLGLIEEARKEERERLLAGLRRLSWWSEAKEQDLRDLEGDHE